MIGCVLANNIMTISFGIISIVKYKIPAAFSLDINHSWIPNRVLDTSIQYV